MAQVGIQAQGPAGRVVMADIQAAWDDAQAIPVMQALTSEDSLTSMLSVLNIRTCVFTRKQPKGCVMCHDKFKKGQQGIQFRLGHYYKDDKPKWPKFIVLHLSCFLLSLAQQAPESWGQYRYQIHKLHAELQAEHKLQAEQRSTSGR